jgi:hypothetical protein
MRFPHSIRLAQLDSFEFSKLTDVLQCALSTKQTQLKLIRREVHDEQLKVL